jgi:hypothetical protein
VKDGGSSDHIDVYIRLYQQMMMKPHRLPQSTLGTISVNGVANFFTGGHTQTTGCLLASPIAMSIPTNKGKAHCFARFVEPQEIATFL